jgi:aminomethyltransferase
MPVQYAGILAEHQAVRSSLGVFDVSHMGEFEVTGVDRNAFVNRVTCNDISVLSPGGVQYSAILNNEGTFVDDCTVYRFEDKIMIVVNAANRAKAWEHIVDQKKGTNVRLRDISDDIGLLAVQGPNADAAVGPLADFPIKDLGYYEHTTGKIAGVGCFVSRTGYTGEDGFEIFVPPAQAERVWNALLDAGRGVDIRPCGLGARDTLRLEARMCLYGNDMDETTSLVEAGLGWIVSLDDAKGDFPGRAILAEQKKTGPPRKLVGFEMVGRGIARHGYGAYLHEDAMGHVTSGSYAPFLQKNIGLCYVPAAQSAVGKKPMTKTQFVQHLSEKTELKKSDVEYLFEPNATDVATLALRWGACREPAYP